MLGSLFGRPTFLDSEVEEWQLDVWAELVDRFGRTHPLPGAPVVLPTRDFFPPTEATGHDKALHVFGCLMTLMKIDPSPWVLEPQSRRTTGQQVSEFVTLGGRQAPNGTFRVMADGTVLITYAPDLIDEPMHLVATLAHELCHYLIGMEPDLAEDETHELMTDLAVAFTGLGVFGANAAFSFEQHGDAFSQGWRSRSSGYLSPRSWAFALAVFGELRGDDGDMGRYLKPEIEGLRQKALKYLRKHPDRLDGLRAEA